MLVVVAVVPAVSAQPVEPPLLPPPSRPVPAPGPAGGEHPASCAFYAGCPAAGTTVAVDGFYESPNYPAALTAGQQVLVWVGTAYWATPVKAGPYTLTIQKQ